GDEGVPLAAALSADGRRLAVGGVPFGRGAHGPLIHVLSLDGKVGPVLTGHEDVITGLAFSRDGKRLASCSEDRTGLLHDLQQGRQPVALRHPAVVRAVAWAPDGLHLATASADGVARVWNVRTAAAVELRGHKGAVACVAWGPDGRSVATGGADGSVRLWAP